MTFTHADFQRGDIVHIHLGCGITRRYSVRAVHTRHLDLHDPVTGDNEQRTYDQVASRTPRASGEYFEALIQSRRDGTSWSCRCGCRNPGTWDTCQECQTVHPDA
jgi:hypothetical protein